MWCQNLSMAWKWYDRGEICPRVNSGQLCWTLFEIRISGTVVSSNKKRKESENIFIHSLDYLLIIKVIRYSSVYHFADDTNLLNINTSLQRMQKQINIDLKLLYKWLLGNKISLNCSKTELIIFHKPGHQIRNHDFRIKLNGHRIRPSTSIKYLGIHLDPTLSGYKHCDILASKLKRANGMLSKVRHYVPREELRSIYHALPFSSHLIYSC